MTLVLPDRPVLRNARCHLPDSEVKAPVQAATLASSLTPYETTIRLASEHAGRHRREKLAQLFWQNIYVESIKGRHSRLRRIRTRVHWCKKVILSGISSLRPHFSLKSPSSAPLSLILSANFCSGQLPPGPLSQPGTGTIPSLMLTRTKASGEDSFPDPAGRHESRSRMVRPPIGVT